MGERPPTPPGRANGDGTNGRVHFSVFEVDLSAGELRKSGLKIKLQGQPFEVLALLLERPGELVTREELHQKLWASDTVVDFEQGLNKAINKLREALGDVANTPRYVETLPRRGYRFIAPVEVLAAAAQRSSPPAKEPRVPHWILRSFDAIRTHSWRTASIAALLFVAIVAAYLARHSFRRPTPLPVTRAVIKLEPGYMLDGNRAEPPFGIGQPTETAMAISSDARFVVYSAIRENPEPEDKPQLYLRRTDQLEAKPIAGTEGGISPFLSPDDRWVGFWADGKLTKISIDGGAPVRLPVTLTWSDRTCCVTGSWGPNNKIVFASGVYARLHMVSADGGALEILTTPDRSKGEFSHRLPHWLPDGKGVLFTIMREWFDEHPRVAVLDLKARTWRVLLEDAADARFIASGHLVFLRQGTLMAAPFDLERRELAGEPVPAVANLMQALNIGDGMNSAAGQFSVSDSSSLVYAPGGINPDRQDSLVWVDMKGNATPVTSLRAWFWAPRLSPDGRQIAYITVGRDWHAWIYDLSRGTVRQFTQEGKADFALWTPDGKHLVFTRWAAGQQANLYWQASDGSSEAERLTTSDNHQVSGSISPDGTTLAFVERHPDAIWDIQLLDLKSGRVTSFLNSKAAQLFPEFSRDTASSLNSKAAQLFPEFSPDGHWMAYTSFESGRQEVYVRPFPGPGGEFKVSPEAGAAPLWARNGKRLFYRGLNGEYLVTDVRTDGGFSTSKPRLMFKSDQFIVDDGPNRTWDISPDGQRFLMVRYGERKPQPVTEFILVQNWFEELKRLAPTGKK